MQDKPRREPNICPGCSAPVGEGRPVGIWTGVEIARKVPLSGIGYGATCKRCGLTLQSFPTDEEASAREFHWEIRALPARQASDEKREREELLRPLLETHAHQSEVFGRLELKFADFSADSRERPELQRWLFLDEVNAAAAHYPGILFHISALTMTWLFFDSRHRLQGYFVRHA